MARGGQQGSCARSGRYFLQASRTSMSIDDAAGLSRPHPAGRHPSLDRMSFRTHDLKTILQGYHSTLQSYHSPLIDSNSSPRSCRALLFDIFLMLNLMQIAYHPATKTGSMEDEGRP